MKKLVLINLILLTCLTFGFGQTKVLLDSSFYYYGVSPSVWEQWGRTYYQYDKFGKITQKQEIAYNSAFGWKDTKENYFYNEYGWNDLITHATRWGNETIWKMTMRTAISYNSKGSPIKYVSEQIESNLWDTIGITHYEYDTKNRRISISSSDYYRYVYAYDDKDSIVRTAHEVLRFGNWEAEDEQLYDYDENGNLIRTYFAYYTPNYPAWEHRYTYDSLNRQITKTRHYHDYSGNTTKLVRDTFIYNNQNQIVEQYVNEFINTWESKNERFLYTYNANGMLSEKIQQYRNNSNSPWYNYAKEYIVYDQENQPIEIYTNVFWSVHNQLWYGGERRTFEYDTYGMISLNSYKDWVGDINGYPRNQYKNLYFYSEKEINTPDFSPPNPEENCFFTNPYQPFTTINCTDWVIDKTYQLQVFSIDGKLTYKTNFLGFDGFRVEKNLDRGWYVFVVLEDGKIVKKQKILVF